MPKTSRLKRLLKPRMSGTVELTETETNRLRLRWRRCFAANLGRELSAEASGGYDWHAFSYEKFPHLTGDAARNAFRARSSAPVLFLLPHRGEGNGFRAQEAPDFSRAALDVYIFPGDLSWTMVFTHEDDWLGPYFAEV